MCLLCRLPAGNGDLGGKLGNILTKKKLEGLVWKLYECNYIEMKKVSTPYTTGGHHAGTVKYKETLTMAPTDLMQRTFVSDTAFGALYTFSNVDKNDETAGATSAPHTIP